MPRRQPEFTLSDAVRAQLLKNVDDNPVNSGIYKKSVTLLESAKGTAGNIIARCLSLTANAIIKIRKDFIRKGMKSLEKDLPRNAYNREPLYKALKKMLENNKNNGITMTQDEMAAQLSCSESKIKKLLKEIEAKESESNVNMFGFNLCHICANQVSGRAIFYTEPNNSLLFINTEGKDIIIFNRIGVGSLVDVLDSIKEFENKNYDIHVGIPLSDVLSSKELAGKKIITVSFGIVNDLFNKENIIIAKDFEEFVKICAGFLKSDHIYKNWLGKKLIQEIKKIKNNQIITSFSWTMSVSSKRFILNTADDIENKFQNDENSTINLTCEIKEDNKTIKEKFSKKIDCSLLKEILSALNLNDYIKKIGQLEDMCFEIALQGALLFVKKIINQIMVESGEKFSIAPVEGILGRLHLPIPSKFSDEKKPHETLYSPSMLYNIASLITNVSYREAANIINDNNPNRMGRPIEHRRLNDVCQILGRAREDLDENFLNILKLHNYDPLTGLKNDINNPNEQIQQKGKKVYLYDNNLFGSAAYYVTKHNAKHPDTILPYEAIFEIEYNPLNCVYISIDGVYAPHQKDKRDESEKDSKYVSHTNVAIKTKEGVYHITAKNTNEALRYTLAYILKNNFQDRQLVFITDGARDIRENVKKIFYNFNEYPTIFLLDWFHLAKRVKESCSMIFYCGKKNLDEKKKLTGAILKQLWYGRINGAINFMKNINPKKIRNGDLFNGLIEYINSRKEYICSYALRRYLRLINSSNSSERANFLIVCKRQKHNGYSWGKSGSYSMAIIRTLKLNGQLKDYIFAKKIKCEPKPGKKPFWSADKLPKKVG